MNSEFILLCVSLCVFCALERERRKGHNQVSGFNLLICRDQNKPVKLSWQRCWIPEKQWVFLPLCYLLVAEFTPDRWIFLQTIILEAHLVKCLSKHIRHCWIKWRDIDDRKSKCLATSSGRMKGPWGQSAVCLLKKSVNKHFWAQSPVWSKLG